jgi:hypothetical protein
MYLFITPQPRILYLLAAITTLLNFCLSAICSTNIAPEWHNLLLPPPSPGLHLRPDQQPHSVHDGSQIPAAQVLLDLWRVRPYWQRRAAGRSGELARYNTEHMARDSACESANIGWCELGSDCCEEEL